MVQNPLPSRSSVEQLSKTDDNTATPVGAVISNNLIVGPTEKSRSLDDPDQESPQSSKLCTFRMDEQQFEKYNESASSHGMCFSEFVRRACEILYVQLENDGFYIEFKPILRRFDKSDKIQSELVKNLTTMNRKLIELDKRVNKFEPSQLDSEKIADQILTLRDHEKETWSLTEWAAEFDLTRGEVDLGRKQLEKWKSVVRIEPENAEVGQTRWRFRK